MKATRKKPVSGAETIRGLGEEAMQAGRKVWLAGLGALSLAQEKGGEVFDDLVEKGKKYHKGEPFAVGGTLKKATRDLRGMRGTVETRIQEATGMLLHRSGVPTHDEIRTLMNRVEQLSAKVQRARSAH